MLETELMEPWLWLTKLCSQFLNHAAEALLFVAVMCCSDVVAVVCCALVEVTDD